MFFTYFVRFIPTYYFLLGVTLNKVLLFNFIVPGFITSRSTIDFCMFI